MDQGHWSRSPDSRSGALPYGGPGWEGHGEQEPSVTCLSYQGTTGSPKGATLSHYNIVNNSNMIGDRLKLHLKVRGLAQALQGVGVAGLPLLASGTGWGWGLGGALLAPG